MASYLWRALSLHTCNLPLSCSCLMHLISISWQLDCSSNDTGKYQWTAFNICIVRYEYFIISSWSMHLKTSLIGSFWCSTLTSCCGCEVATQTKPCSLILAFTSMITSLYSGLLAMSHLNMPKTLYKILKTHKWYWDSQDVQSQPQFQYCHLISAVY